MRTENVISIDSHDEWSVKTYTSTRYDGTDSTLASVQDVGRRVHIMSLDVAALRDLAGALNRAADLLETSDEHVA